MAIVAKIELTGSLTHSARGRIFKKGMPQILTDPSDVSYYQTQADFCVTILDKPKDAKPASTPATKGEESLEESKPGARKPRKRYTETELKNMNKAQLAEIAVGYGLAVEDTTKKADIVADIVEAQS
jgi:hypothetical protein